MILNIIRGNERIISNISYHFIPDKKCIHKIFGFFLSIFILPSKVISFKKIKNSADTKKSQLPSLLSFFFSRAYRLRKTLANKSVNALYNLIMLRYKLRSSAFISPGEAIRLNRHTVVFAADYLHS